MFRKALITSGPTLEPIDPVRYISNRSSGKMGYALAVEAKQRGVESVIFVTGPTAYIPPDCEIIRVETTAEMREAVLRNMEGCRVLIMAAAVCDYRPLKPQSGKIKKSRENLAIELVPNPDILRELGRIRRPGQILVGFAAETENILENARKKLESKKADLIVLNEISPRNPAFGADVNQVFLVSAGGVEELPPMTKAEVAARVWDGIEAAVRNGREAQ